MGRFERWLLGRHATDRGQSLPRARLVAWFCLSLAVVAAAFVFVSLVSFGLPLLAVVCGVGVVAFVTLLAWIRRGGALHAASVVLLVVCHLVLAGAALTSTGATALMTPWLGVVLLLAAYLIGGRASLLCAATLATLMVTLFTVEHFGWYVPPDPRFHEVAVQTLVPGLMSLAVTASMGLFYRRLLDHELAGKLQAEVELGKAQRLESMGSLVAGIAHEVNNPLSFIRTNVDWVREQLALEPGNLPVAECAQALAETAEGVERVRRIVADLKAFSRESDEGVEWFSLHEAVDFALKMASNLLRHTARVRVDVPEDLQVEAPLTRLGQVLLNLITNAAQAIPPGQVEANELAITARLGPRGCTLEVRDTGSGIAREHLDRVFDPFFTTKPVGQGTGLGLSVSLGIVQRFGGTLRVASTVGKGTVVTLELPRARDGAAAETAEPKPSAIVLPKGIRILVLDDEAAIGRSIQRLLSDVEVALETDSGSALALCSRERFDLVLCDVMMPQVGGEAFLDRLAALWPDARQRVIFMTGGALDAASSALIERTQVLMKPFDERSLRQRVLEHLARSPRILRARTG